VCYAQNVYWFAGGRLICKITFEKSGDTPADSNTLVLYIKRMVANVVDRQTGIWEGETQAGIML
jgi:hypothetical protein